MSADASAIWDVLVLTAGNFKQKRAFELQLLPDYGKYYSAHIIVQDQPPNTKIGSGGATLNALAYLYNIYGESIYSMRILILHSGGFSQRLPHVAALGKLFMLLPNGRTLLEQKLLVMSLLVTRIPFGVFIAAADTLECFGARELRVFPEDDVILIGHESDLNVAIGHGVYVLDESGDLEYVLQKPSKEELSRIDTKSRSWITDSCYFIPSKLVQNLVDAGLRNGPVMCELCAYGDFLRPLGKRPLLNYINDSANDDLRKWRVIMREVTKNVNAIVWNLGPDTFFHFGTNPELLTHFSVGSSFCSRILAADPIHNIICSTVNNVDKISAQSFVEYCQLKGNFEIEKGCIMRESRMNNKR
ncbi:l-fucokinase domain-containing protein [Ditylenchus destructor]|nr:l-fucokinase domain-containing protein [Ditylenchus destructor]